MREGLAAPAGTAGLPVGFQAGDVHLKPQDPALKTIRPTSLPPKLPLGLLARRGNALG
jgi:hypothetical protein